MYVALRLRLESLKPGPQYRATARHGRIPPDHLRRTIHTTCPACTVSAYSRCRTSDRLVPVRYQLPCSQAAARAYSSRPKDRDRVVDPVNIIHTVSYIYLYSHILWLNRGFLCIYRKFEIVKLYRMHII